MIRSHSRRSQSTQLAIVYSVYWAQTSISGTKIATISKAKASTVQHDARQSEKTRWIKTNEELR